MQVQLYAESVHSKIPGTLRCASCEKFIHPKALKYVTQFLLLHVMLNQYILFLGQKSCFWVEEVILCSLSPELLRITIGAERNLTKRQSDKVTRPSHIPSQTPFLPPLMAQVTSLAGPSSRPMEGKQKKRSTRENSELTPPPPSKAARIDPVDSEDVDMDSGGAAGVDPMEQLASGNQDSMEQLEKVGNGADPMKELEHQNGDNGDSNMPRRADEFEQEAEMEIEASKGLDGAVTGDEGRMKLVHQVRHQASFLQFVRYVLADRLQVALPPGYPYKPIAQHKRLDPPARTYKFELDPFQLVATSCIERNESVLVSAHTSAGKTVVAEFAIATCLNEGRRVVYTSPIKALSNQKYREFLEIFSDVGLMTGDVTINPTASCLVMTTEILRSMLYRGSEVMREVAWVIFDEVHYMRDKERGVVWEETIILLPQKVRYVFLSATIPNSMEFAEWICKTHEQPCHVVYTDFRPTPLQHYLFPAGSEGIYLVVDERSNFREDNFQKAMAALAQVQGEDPSNPSSGRNKKGKTRKGGAMKGELKSLALADKLRKIRYLQDRSAHYDPQP